MRGHYFCNIPLLSFSLSLFRIAMVFNALLIYCGMNEGIKSLILVENELNLWLCENFFEEIFWETGLICRKFIQVNFIAKVTAFPVHLNTGRRFNSSLVELEGENYKAGNLYFRVGSPNLTLCYGITLYYTLLPLYYCEKGKHINYLLWNKLFVWLIESIRIVWVGQKRGVFFMTPIGYLRTTLMGCQRHK